MRRALDWLACLWIGLTITRVSVPWTHAGRERKRAEINNLIAETLARYTAK